MKSVGTDSPVTSDEALPLPNDERPGTVIGHYKLLEQIGEGGFGVVFLAEQVEPFHRRVAIKIVKPGMDTKQVIARFEVERQALAMMDHPNIAHLYDAGTTASGRPYFVMEFVEGLPLTGFCDANDLAQRERLQLFLKVCEAVQHAHQKGIIHRDLKPSNILVAVQDGKPVPKVIDFGTAKALQHPLTDKTMFTVYGNLIATPLYMSPEQAEMSGLDVDTRSDIYSLGVLLYELLTGTTPLEDERLRTSAFEEMLRIIREEEPPRPSARVGMLGVRAKEIAGHRQTDPGMLRRTLQGDLDWIVMKALDKDRRRRYVTANALVEDIRHHLDHEPVLASPPGRVYRMRKFIRRHRVGVTAGGALSLALTAGLCASLLGFAQAQRQRNRALAAEASEKAARQLAESFSNQNQKNYLAARRNLYAADMAAASRAIANGNLARANQLLDAHQPKPGEPDVRGIEWRCNWALAQGEQVATLPAGSEVSSVAVSHDGKRIAGGLASGAVQLWDLDSLQPTGSFTAHPSRCWDLDFSPDGKWLVSSGSEGVSIWDLPTLQCRKSSPTWHRDVGFSPDGKLLPIQNHRNTATGTWSEATSICDGTTLEELFTLPFDCGLTAFSPDGRLLAMGKPIKIVDLKTRSLIRTIPEELASSYCFSADGRNLFVCGYNEDLRVWNTGDGSRIILPTGQNQPGNLRLSPDGHLLAVAGADGVISLWLANEHKRDKTLRGHQSSISGLEFTPDGRLLVSGSRDGTIRLWRTESPTPGAAQRIDHGYPVELGAGGNFCRFSSDGRWLAAPCSEGIKVIEAAKRRRHTTLSTMGMLVGFIPGANKLVAINIQQSGIEPPHLEIWDWLANANREVLLRNLPDFPVRILGFALDPNGAHLALILVTNNNIRKPVSVDLNTGNCTIFDLNLEWTSRGGISLSPDGRFAAIGDTRQTWLCRWPECVPVKALTENESYTTQSVFSPDSSRLAVAAGDGRVRIWEIPSGRLLFTLSGQRTGLMGLSFSPDNLTLAVSFDNDTTFWHLPTQRESMVWRDTVAAEFSPDGSTLARVTGDYSLFLLQTPTREAIEGINAKPRLPLQLLLDTPTSGFAPIE